MKSTLLTLAALAATAHAESVCQVLKSSEFFPSFCQCQDGANDASTVSCEVPIIYYGATLDTIGASFTIAPCADPMSLTLDITAQGSVPLPCPPYPPFLYPCFSFCIIFLFVPFPLFLSSTQLLNLIVIRRVHLLYFCKLSLLLR
jgi:hypothetical protein